MLEHIGDRLREERKKLDLSQREFSKLAGVTSQAQFKYEHNKILPRANYFVNINSIGIDVNYVLFGVKGELVRNEEERKLLHLFRTSKDLQRFILFGIKN
ncbi:XRE family transcriptional regulator [Pasteurella sp. WM03]|nr:XRE family transcriptional regulator [Pasteurella sp. WM03]